jgi:aldose 1-epimerase
VTEFEIQAAAYTAVVDARGAAVRQLRHSGRDLIVPFPQGGPIPDYRGITAAPWPNRIPDGSYAFDGTRYLVPVNEISRACALHGLVFDDEWSLESKRESSVTLSYVLQPSPGYPFRLKMLIHYHVKESGLSANVAATNLSTGTAPYGACPHPYLIAGPAPLGEWTLQLPANEFLEVTPDRLLPVARQRVAGHEFDFRTPRPIATTRIDHAFTDIGFDGHGLAQVVVRDPGGTGVGIEWNRTLPWVQIHTADKEPPLPSRIGLAVEPMTCPPDAFNSGIDLVRLEPGATHEASWRIFAV